MSVLDSYVMLSDKASVYLYKRCSAVFMVTYIALVCCEGVRRRWPGNIICLAVFVSR